MTEIIIQNHDLSYLAMMSWRLSSPGSVNPFSVGQIITFVCFVSYLGGGTTIIKGHKNLPRFIMGIFIMGIFIKLQKLYLVSWEFKRF